jgi:UDP-2,3-diacylglucosamine pyrophosphatase LpxH
MRRILRFILLKPVLWAAARFSSRPDPAKIFAALTELFDSILHEPGKKGLVIPFEYQSGKFIIFSDQHKGRRNGADDFMLAEPNYLAALDHYSREDYFFINLGDSEELWENTLWQVRKKNKATFEAEKKFIAHNRYIKISGNHDLYWNTSPLAPVDLQLMYGERIKVYEGLILQTLVTDTASADPLDHSPLTIYLTHGHQGDAQSDGNWFSKFFVGWIWAPLQALLRINPNTPAYDAEKKTLHNSLMYDWISPQPGKMLITGHTHQPVFASLTHLERLYKQFQLAGQENNKERSAALLDEIKKREKEFTAVALDYMNMKPSYFNSGCCCFSDGDITGIEIADGCIRLVKWALVDERPGREVLEEMELKM